MSGQGGAGGDAEKGAAGAGEAEKREEDAEIEFALFGQRQAHRLVTAMIPDAVKAALSGDGVGVVSTKAGHKSVGLSPHGLSRTSRLRLCNEAWLKEHESSPRSRRVVPLGYNDRRIVGYFRHYKR